MTNHIIQEVRDARAALAAEHNYGHRKIFEWAKTAHAARQQELQKTSAQDKALLPSGKARGAGHSRKTPAVAK